jgi:hypothetical protein
VCEDPAVLLRLLAAGRALGDEAAAAACGRLRLTLGRGGRQALPSSDCPSLDDEDSSDSDSANDDSSLSSLSDCEDSGHKPRQPRIRPSREDCQRLCREQAAFVERRGALLAELSVVCGSPWRYSDHEDRPIERVLAPALQRGAAAGRLAGLRAVEVPGFELEGGLLDALALCPALTRLRLGSLGTFEDFDRCVRVGDGRPSVEQLRAVGGGLAALCGLRELDLAFGCERAAAPAVAGLSALTRLTRLRLALAGRGYSKPECGIEHLAMTREWSGVHKLPASLEDLTLSASCKVRGVGANGAD